MAPEARAHERLFSGRHTCTYCHRPGAPATLDRMEHHHSDYCGWKLCTIWGRPCLGNGVRATPPHNVIMAEGSTDALVLEDLRRQVDSIEDAGGDAGRMTEGIGRAIRPGGSA